MTVMVANNNSSFSTFASSSYCVRRDSQSKADYLDSKPQRWSRPVSSGITQTKSGGGSLRLIHSMLRGFRSAFVSFFCDPSFFTRSISSHAPNLVTSLLFVPFLPAPLLFTVFAADIMIKPDGVQRQLVGEIIKRFEQKGYLLVAMKLTAPGKEHLEKHYEDLKDKKFFPGLIEYMTSGPVVAMVWEVSCGHGASLCKELDRDRALFLLCSLLIFASFSSVFRRARASSRKVARCLELLCPVTVPWVPSAGTFAWTLAATCATAVTAWSRPKRRLPCGSPRASNLTPVAKTPGCTSRGFGKHTSWLNRSRESL